MGWWFHLSTDPEMTDWKMVATPLEWPRAPMRLISCHAELEAVAWCPRRSLPQPDVGGKTAACRLPPASLPPGSPAADFAGGRPTGNLENQRRAIIDLLFGCAIATEATLIMVPTMPATCAALLGA